MKHKIGLVFASGGIRMVGASIGAWKALQPYLKKHHWIPHVVVGVSGGAVLAPKIAQGWDSEKLYRFYTKYATPDMCFDYQWNIIHGFIKGNKIDQAFNNAYRNQNLEDLPAKTIIIASEKRFFRYYAKIFKTGPIAEALGATMSIPGIIEGKVIHGRRYFDGGITRPFPVDVAIGNDATKIFVVTVQTLRPTIMDLITLRFSQVLFEKNQEQWQHIKKVYPFIDVIHINVPTSIRMNPWDVDLLPYVIYDGEKAAKKVLYG